MKLLPPFHLFTTKFYHPLLHRASQIPKFMGGLFRHTGGQDEVWQGDRLGDNNYVEYIHDSEIGEKKLVGDEHWRCYKYLEGDLTMFQPIMDPAQSSSTRGNHTHTKNGYSSLHYYGQWEIL